jgi:lipid-A-disaccharide synthase
MANYRLFISTGEVSGDLQGALLIAALKRKANDLGIDLDISALGGERMAAAGATLLADTSGIGAMGLVEALPFVMPTLRVQQQAKRYLQQSPPDGIVLIDNLGPNVVMGRFARQRFPKIPIFYYIAPQEWVWSINDRNTTEIANFTDRVFAVFPGEAQYYSQQGLDVTWVGHPFLDQLESMPTREQARAQLGIQPTDRAIALLPASRQQELKYLLPAIFEAAQQIQAELATTQLSNRPLFWIPLSLDAYRPRLEQAIKHYGLKAQIVAEDHARQCAIAAADLAITKSGTANLEIALMQVPQVVIYRFNPITYWIARHLLKVTIPYMSPPNLILMRAIVPELLQEQATPHAIATAGLDLLLNSAKRTQLQSDYQAMRLALGEPGVCDRAALEILQSLINSPTVS